MFLACIFQILNRGTDDSLDERCSVHKNWKDFTPSRWLWFCVYVCVTLLLTISRMKKKNQENIGLDYKELCNFKSCEVFN